MSQGFNRIFRNQLAGPSYSATPPIKYAAVTCTEVEKRLALQTERVSCLQKALCPEELFSTSATNRENEPALMFCLCLRFLLIFQNHSLTHLKSKKKKICIFFIVFQSDPSTVLLMDRLIIIAPFSLIAT